MSDSLERLPTIENNLRIALANSGDWIGPSDTGAIAALLRLARLIDQLLDMGETKDLPALMSRLTSLMEQLHLTPKSRADQDLLPKEIKKDGADFQAAYLRIVRAEGQDDSGKRSNSRTASSRASGGSRSTAAPVAKKRPK